jgi:predicted nucleic acid-binding protein
VIPVLLDTKPYSAFRGGNTDALAIVQRAPVIGISAISLCELYAGFAGGSLTGRNHADLSTFLASPRVRVLNVDAGTAPHYAAVINGLRRIGRPIPTNDVLIAAVATQHTMAVFTYDAHFRHVGGLRVVQTLSDLLTQP